MNTNPLPIMNTNLFPKKGPSFNGQNISLAVCVAMVAWVVPVTAQPAADGHQASIRPSEYNEANHPPVVQLAHKNVLSVKQGEKVILDGSESRDPDNNNLNHKWIYYREAGSFAGGIKIENSDAEVAIFVAPKVDRAKTIHFILQVTDDGKPALTRYQRVIVNVTP